MKIANVSREGDITSVCLQGTITQSVVSSFGDPFRDQLGASIYEQTLIIDMSGVAWIDSSGIGWLLSCWKKFRQSSGRMILHSLAAPVSDVFRVLNLHSTFHVVPNAAAAESLRRGEPA